MVAQESTVPTQTISLSVSGMSCSACVAHVEKTLLKQKGVSKAAVNLALEKATIEFDASHISAQQLAQAVSEEGYASTEITHTSLRQANQQRIERNAQEYKALLRKFLVSLPFSVLVMILSMVAMLEQLHPWEQTLNVLQAILVLPVVLYSGAHFYTNAWKSFKAASATMDTLVALGTASAIGFSLWLTAQSFVEHMHHLHTYFDSASTIITLILFGKVLESRAKQKATSALTELLELQEPTAHVIRNNVEFVVPIDDVDVNDVLIVRAGEGIAVDGTIALGSATINESILTGESMPVEKSIGDVVYSGTIVSAGFLQYKATATGATSTLATIARLTDEAQTKKPRVQHLADSISAVFVPVILVISILTALVWLFAFPQGTGLDAVTNALTKSISVLVIACPCALGLATPTALVVAMGRSSTNGIVINDADALEKLYAIDTIVFDKTGTLTIGKPQVVREYSLLQDATLSSDERNEWIAAIESRTEHPVAKAVAQFALSAKSNSSFVEITTLQTLAGFGVRAQVQNREVLLGNLSLMQQHRVDCSAAPLAQVGSSMVYCAFDGVLQVCYEVRDAVRDTSAEAVATLKSMNIDCVLCSGDTQEVVDAVASQVGITKAIGAALPQEKLAFIQQLESQGKKVAMVGDGVNDAPALAQAYVGIAIGSGTDIARNSAGITLVHNNIQQIVHALSLSRKAITIIKQNLFFAFIYNVLGVLLASGVFSSWGIELTPMFAAFAMAMSSVSVVANALRLRNA